MRRSRDRQLELFATINRPRKRLSGDQPRRDQSTAEEAAARRRTAQLLAGGFGAIDWGND